MLINKLSNFLINNKISKIIFNNFLNKSTFFIRLHYLLKHSYFINNWMDLILLLLNLKKKVDIYFKNNFCFQNFKKKNWRYLIYYLTVFKNNIFIEKLGNDYFAKIGNNRLKLLNIYNGIYQVGEVFVRKTYNKFDYKNKVVIDIGGFIGDSALFFILKGARKVYVYEVNEEVYKVLLENIRINQLDNKIVAFNKGISNEYKREILYITEKKGSTSFYSSFNIKENIIDKKPIELIPFDEILEEPVDILKMDCEGSEYDILESILNNNLSDKIKEGVILESHNLDKKRNYEYIIELLEKIGFKSVNFEKKTEILGLIYAKK